MLHTEAAGHACLPQESCGHWRLWLGIKRLRVMWAEMEIQMLDFRPPGKEGSW
jgi:hypothetical protein